MTHAPLPPFAATAGPRDARLVIVGEAWGHSESLARQPFVGESGKLLWHCLAEGLPDKVNENWHRAADLHRYGDAWMRERAKWLADSSIMLTNVLALQPPGNKLDALCGTKKEVEDALGGPYTLPALAKGKYLRPEYLPELDRLYSELRAARPNLVLALGNTACWALLRVGNISQIRGTTALAGEGGAQGLKVLPSYHPAAVLRQWNWRPIVIADIMKAGREMEFPEIRRPRREVLVNPTLAEVQFWCSEVLANPPALLGADCETMFGQIEMISFAKSPREAISIPFIDKSRPGWNYWATPEEEHGAMNCVAALLESPIPKCFQNGMYDLQYLLAAGIWPRAMAEDTMLLHHALFPEMLKGLGFLGSIYGSGEGSWKLMRRGKTDSVKRDE